MTTERQLSSIGCAVWIMATLATITFSFAALLLYEYTVAK